MSETYPMKPVGTVRNGCHDTAQAAAKRDAESVIVVDQAYEEALFGIESCEFVDVVFYFHKSGTETGTPSWRRRTKSGEERGVFASRAPVRPNLIGITTVRLLGRDGNRLHVTGLDAIDGTPVLDIKSCNTSHLDDMMGGDMTRGDTTHGDATRGNLPQSATAVHTSLLKSNPRMAIQKHIIAGDTEKLLLLAAQIHGHYCPGLAMGVMAAVHAMQQLDKATKNGSGPVDLGHTPSEQSKSSDPDGEQTATASDGLEDLLAIVETNNCFADGVQLVTGCSFGNNSLIFEDLGKTAFTLTRRDGKGVRVISRHESPDYIRASFPDFDERYKRVVKQQIRDGAEMAAFKKSGIERAFGTLNLDFDQMFDTQHVTVDIPDYAPSHESGVCARCGESVMATRLVDGGDTSTRDTDMRATTADHPKLCLKCAGEPFAVLDGHGIRPSARPGPD